MLGGRGRQGGGDHGTAAIVPDKVAPSGPRQFVVDRGTCRGEIEKKIVNEGMGYGIWGMGYADIGYGGLRYGDIGMGILGIEVRQ